MVGDNPLSAAYKQFNVQSKLHKQLILSHLKNTMTFIFTTDKGLSPTGFSFVHNISNHLKIYLMNTTVEQQKETAQVITPSELLKHWQGHRSLTRRVIEAFPEEAFFNHSIGGMRTFAELTMELLGIAGPGIQEIATGNTSDLKEHFDHDNSKAKILELWDRATEEINANWSQIPIEKFQETIKIFGQYEGTVMSSIFYFIDNEIHHRGQGYVYLRSLGIEPPAFWER